MCPEAVLGYFLLGRNELRGKKKNSRHCAGRVTNGCYAFAAVQRWQVQQ